MKLRIDDVEVEAQDGMSILEAADRAGIYIPRLCHHPSLGSSHGLKPVEKVVREDGEHKGDGSGPAEGFEGCRLCLVEIKGRPGLFTACDTKAEQGMTIETGSEVVRKARKDSLAKMLLEHPHACLLCAQHEGCPRTQCSSKVPEDERCCPKLGHCELQKVSEFVGIKEDISKYNFKGLPRHKGEPLFDRDYNLCVSCLRCVRACRDLRGLSTLGFVYKNGRPMVGPKSGPQYSDSDCRFCGACVEVCPTGALTDKDLPKGEKYEVLLPCSNKCPAGIDIPRYIDLIRAGKPADAALVIAERMPFPTILGNVCFHPCEEECRRGKLNKPMAICNLKRFASTSGGHKAVAKPGPPTGKKVAVIGGGPAGLSCAYFLARKGHKVTVFEAEPEIGGWLRYAIPDYRLSPKDLASDLSIFKPLGVEFLCGKKVGKDLPLADIRKQYDAVFIGVGATQSRRIPVEGSDLGGVLWGVEFLRDIKNKKMTKLTGRVIVIGGGNVAMDVARSALRLGASSVELVCLESDEEMPAHDWEVDEAVEEGVVMHPCWGPSRIVGTGGKVTGMEFMKCTAVFDASHKFAPTFDKCTTKKLDADIVIMAIGQASEMSLLEGSGIEAKGGRIIVNAQQTTNLPGVFAGGEGSRGPASVIEAVADGAKAASGIDKHLGGDGEIYKPLLHEGEMSLKLPDIPKFATLSRVPARKRAPLERKKDFSEVEHCFSAEEAKAEAARCLRCDLRLKIMPVTLPPEKWVELNEANVSKVPAKEGVYQLLDEKKAILAIKSSQNLLADLKAKVGSKTKAKYFGFDVDPMYSKRESELIQHYLQQFGKMPPGDGEGESMDDLF